jgi:hypothetical protein
MGRAKQIVETLKGEVTSPPVKVELAIDLWEHWLQIADEHYEAALAARKQLETVHAAGDEEAKGAALGRELRAGMVAASAAAFAVDSFYASGAGVSNRGGKACLCSCGA